MEVTYMKPRVINGKRYNIHTSNLLGRKGDLSLYRKTTGEYFATENGEYILLLNDLDKTKSIAKELLTEKQYMYEFEIRNTDMVNASLDLPKPIYDKVIALAEKNDSNLKETIRDILFDQLF